MVNASRCRLEAALRDCLVSTLLNRQHLDLVVRVRLDEFRRERHLCGCGREADAECKQRPWLHPLDDNLVADHRDRHIGARKRVCDGIPINDDWHRFKRRSFSGRAALPESSQKLLQREIPKGRLRALEEEFGDPRHAHAGAAADIEDLLPIRVENFQPVPTRASDENLNTPVSSSTDRGAWPEAGGPPACRSRSNESIFQPSAWRRISSSSVMPVPNRRVREQRPPIERAATSTTQGPASLTLSSAWTGPSVSPSAAHARRVTSAMRACVPAGRRDGVT